MKPGQCTHPKAEINFQFYKVVYGKNKKCKKALIFLRVKTPNFHIFQMENNNFKKYYGNICGNMHFH